jgi:predicted alpha/beta superfamily hydrolase
MNKGAKLSRYFYYFNLSVILLFIFISLPKVVTAQIDSLPIHNEEAILLHSKVMSEDRTLWIHLPANYKSTSNSYPVLYVLDAGNHFNHASEAVGFLAGYDRNRMPEMIVIGIVNVDRGRDFTPVYLKNAKGALDSSKTTSNAGAGRFLRYIADEVIPYVDTHYRVQPYRILTGHSLGGLFALYAKEQMPNLFPAMILTSPAINGINDRMLSNIHSFIKVSHPHNGKLFIAIGNENTQKVDSLTSGLKQFAPTWLNWAYKKYDDENHFSAPYKSLFDGLKFIYKEWFIDYFGNTSISYQDILRHFKKLSYEFGYHITVTEEFVNNCGYNQLNNGHIKNAIGLFVENVKAHPNSYNAYDSLGEAYMKSGNTSLAIFNYKKSIELNPHNEGGKEMLKKLIKGKK